MKVLILISALLVSLAANAMIMPVGKSTNLDYAGAVMSETLEKHFINVKANGAIGAGKVAALDLTADDGATVVIAPVSGLAPICVMVNDCATGKLCKCQVYGLMDTVKFDSGDGSAVAGHKAVVSSGNAGYVAARATDLATERQVGYFYDNASASGSVQLFIKF